MERRAGLKADTYIRRMRRKGRGGGGCIEQRRLKSKEEPRAQSRVTVPHGERLRLGFDAGGEEGVYVGDYTALEGGPAGVGGGVAAESDEGVGNFGGRDGAVERLGVNFVAAIDGETIELIVAVELDGAGSGAAPTAEAAGDDGAGGGVYGDNVSAEDSGDAGGSGGKRERIGGEDVALDGAEIVGVEGIVIEDAEAGAVVV